MQWCTEWAALSTPHGTTPDVMPVAIEVTLLAYEVSKHGGTSVSSLKTEHDTHLLRLVHTTCHILASSDRQLGRAWRKHVSIETSDTTRIVHAWLGALDRAAQVESRGSYQSLVSIIVLFIYMNGR